MFPDLLLRIHGRLREEVCTWDEFEKEEFLRVRSNVRCHGVQRRMMLVSLVNTEAQGHQNIRASP